MEIFNAGDWLMWLWGLIGESEILEGRSLGRAVPRGLLGCRNKTPQTAQLTNRNLFPHSAGSGEVQDQGGF